MTLHILFLQFNISFDR